MLQSRPQSCLSLVMNAIVALWFLSVSKADTLHSLVRDPSGAVSGPNPGFRKVEPQASGLQLVHHFPDGAPLRLFQDFGASAGICTGDIDGDGLPDVFVGNYDQGGRLYRNLGGLRFQDITHHSGIDTGRAWCTGVCFVDLENDGDLDLVVCAYRSPNMVFINDGKGVFVESAKSLGLAFEGASIMMAFADYDRDGLLDAYLVTHRYVDAADSKLPSNTRETMDRNLLIRQGDGYRVAPAFEEMFGLVDKGGGRMELMITGQADHLYRNQGSSGFSEVSEQAGIAGYDIGLAAIWWDYNDDGAPDLYVSNDYKGADKLYQNMGDGTFENVHIKALPYVPWSSMGSAIGDINNDGLIDLMASDMAGTTHQRRNLINDDLNRERWFYLATLPKQVRRNTVFLSTATERVLEVASLAGLAQSDWTWSPKFGDFDHDGWLDLFVTNGMARDFLNGDLLETMRREGNARWLDYPIHREKDLLFHNQGNLRFFERSEEWGIDSKEASFGASVSDLDRDGDLDILITHLEAPISLLENTTLAGRRLLVELEGKASNRRGIGSKISLQTEHGTQTRYLGANSGFMSADEPVAHFAVPLIASSANLMIEWPNGHRQNKVISAWDVRLRVEEPLDQPNPDPAPTHHAFSHMPLTLPSALVHRENPYDDFAVQPLLPSRLSNLGPPLAVADVNQDGRDDFFMGAPIGSPGKLMLQARDKSFAEGTLHHRKQDVLMEDSDALFLDVDSDGDEDLIVLSGGVAYPDGSPGYSDRLYENDGTGALRSMPQFALGALPQSGGVITSADIDHDGDLDIFVGRRTIPRRFGSSPSSGVFLNQQGTFVEASKWAQSEAGRIGMVHGAIWSDVNDDGWMDLLVATDYGPIRIWLNLQGNLEEATAQSGLANWRGHWRGLSAGDVDGDGDMDILATNAGRNDAIDANQGTPHGLMIGEIKGVPHPILIELYGLGDKVYPLRTRQALFNGIPGLIERYPSYAAFANVDQTTLLESIDLQGAYLLQVNTLDTGLMINDGKGQFTFTPLTEICQLAPSFGALLHDIDGDGHQDILIGQNASSKSPELGPSTAGISTLLKGTGSGRFELVAPHQTGLQIFEETRSLARISLSETNGQGLLFGINRRAPKAYQSIRSSHWLSIDLRGKPGNLRAVGSRVWLELESGLKHSFEIQSKSGYATQSSHRILIGLGQANSLTATLNIRWPTGKQSQHQLINQAAGTMSLSEPD